MPLGKIKMSNVRLFKTGCAGLAVVVSAALSGCSSVPSLMGGPSEVDRTFLLAAGNWDRNKDGVVACDEWKAYAAELFDGADAGRKGFVTPEEWKAITAIDKMFETVDFKYYDRNGDGKVDRAEFVDRPNRAFELADRDKNCQLTTVELTAARTAGAPAKTVVPAGSESGSGKGQGPGGAGKIP
jgi:hypothetical protein